jgi:amino-acid N-acetyltransferase
MKRRGRITLRSAKQAEARTLHALISAHLEEGHLLPRTIGELTTHAERFVVASRGRRIVGCAELAPLSAHVAEVRSLAVDSTERGRGVGTMLVNELRYRARGDGFEKLCAFTHAPRYFIQMGFSIVPHTWLLEKVMTDCVRCPLFRACGQYAMVVPLECAQDRSGESTYADGRTPAPGDLAAVRYA